MSRLLLALSLIAVSFGIGRAMVAEGSIDRIYTLPFYAVAAFECHFDECYAGHRGNDYQLGDASAGGEVVAAAYAGYVHREFQPGPGGAGYFMTIDHRNTHMTRYLHLQSYMAAEGSNVARGEIIGYEGNSGGPWCQDPPQCAIWASPYHLHFETKINATPGDYTSGTAVDPYDSNTYLWEDQAPGDSAHQPNHADFSPAIATFLSSSRVDIFARGENNQLYQRTRDGNGAWGGWSLPFGPGATCLRSAPAATTWSTSRLEVFYRGCDNGIWRNWWDGAWHSQGLGGCTLGAPGTASWGPTV